MIRWDPLKSGNAGSVSQRLGASLMIAWSIGLALPLFGQQSISFQRDIQPILSEHCFPCHGQDEARRKADMRLDQLDRQDELPAGTIRPGAAAHSELIKRILSSDPDQIMPPPEANLDLNIQQIERLSQWINEGANWQPHWSFTSPTRPPLPKVANAQWIRNPIDCFILHQMEVRGLTPNPQAALPTLVRRVGMALNGIPPDWDPLQVSQEQRSSRTYEGWVEQFLASPHYGENMALNWLDAARYADTHGYQNDGEREMWPWRDWVVQAFNQNMPYDQFTLEQLAGDLLENPTLDQIIATGFNRNHRYNSEGGSIPAEVITENVADRIETTMTTWTGLTLQCARCHDHKYDPFSMRDYYGLFAIFNRITESGRAIRDGNSEPFIIAPTLRQRETLHALEQAKQKAEQQLANLEDLITSELEIFAKQHDDDIAQLSWMEKGLLHHRSLDANLQGFDAAPNNQDNAKVLSEPTWEDGILGQAALLDGSWEGDLGLMGDFTNQTPYSISLWFKPAASSSGAVFSRIEDGVNGKGYQLTYEDGALCFLSISQGYAGRIGIRTRSTFPPGNWLHVAITYDGSMSARGLQIHVNGQAMDCKITHNNDSNPGGIAGQPFRIGNSPMAAPATGEIDELRLYGRVLEAREIAWLSEPEALKDILSMPADKRQPRQHDVARALYLQNTKQPRVLAAVEQLEASTERLQTYRASLPTVMVMQELDEPRKTFLLERGQYDRPLDPVQPALLNQLLPPDPEWDLNRLGLARWLIHPDHPLTARVQVNRLWQMIFGKGLVSTSEDFGIQGDPPSHPQLLDWLACEFIESGWDIHHILRLMVTSATYRQTTRVRDTHRRLDPDNTWLSRGPGMRLSAFAIRDQWLAASNLLVTHLGGPPVYPYQPRDLWKELSRKTYPQSQGADLYRRSLYTYFKRTITPPLLATFDAAERESCVLRKENTNTPLQALALFNAPILQEAALKLAAEALQRFPDSPQAQVEDLFHRILLRKPSKTELSQLTASHQNYRKMSGGGTEPIEWQNDASTLLVRPEVFPSFCLALGLMALDETLAPR